MKKKINSSTSQVDFVVDNLSRTDRDNFLKQIITAIFSGSDGIDVIASWHETAEINANPERKRKLLIRKRKLQKLHLLQDNV